MLAPHSWGGSRGKPQLKAPPEREGNLLEEKREAICYQESKNREFKKKIPGSSQLKGNYWKDKGLTFPQGPGSQSIEITGNFRFQISENRKIPKSSAKATAW